jgi:glycine dehydrogenase subunit 1
MGGDGLKQIAIQNLQRTNYLKNKFSKIRDYEIINKNPTYNEFLLKCPDLKLLINLCEKNNIMPPLKVSKFYPEMKNIALLCVTEMNSKSDLDELIKIAKECVKNR